MSAEIVIAGVTHTIPTIGEKGWATAVTGVLQAVATNMVTTATALAAELDFGATYGIRAKWFRSKTTNPAATGVARLARTDAVSWRNVANGADLPLTVDAFDQLTWNGGVVATPSAGLDGSEVTASTIDSCEITGSALSGNTYSGSIDWDNTDSSGTPGNVTINKPAGKFAVAIGAPSVTVTNSLVTAASMVFCQIQFTDATHTEIRTVVPGTGSFVYTGNANATAATKVAFIVIN